MNLRRLLVFVHDVQLHLNVPAPRSSVASYFTAPQEQLPWYVFAAIVLLSRRGFLRHAHGAAGARRSLPRAPATFAPGGAGRQIRGGPGLVSAASRRSA